MRRVGIAVCVLLAALLCVSGVLASGFENTGLGTTARGMGGAYRAVADDWTAAYYNPAGYAFVMDNLWGVNLGLIHHRNEITPEFGYAINSQTDLAGWGMLNGQPVNNFHRILNNPAGGIMLRLPYWGETVVGLSIFQPFDYSDAWRIWAPDGSGFSAYNDESDSLMPIDHYKNDLDVVAFQLTLAKSFKDDKLSLGLGLQLLRGDLWFSDLNLRANPVTDARPYDRIVQFSKNQGSGWGFGLRGGMMYRLSEKATLGFTAYLPVDLTITGETDFTIVMPNDGALIEDLVNSTEEELLFLGGSSVKLHSEFETDLNLPASVGLGLSYQVSEKLMVALDGEFTLWSHYEGLAFTYTDMTGLPLYAGTPNEINPEFFTSSLTNPVEWDNAAKGAFGARYDWVDAITLLGGVSFDQSPQRSSTEITPQFIDTGDKFGINGGALFHFNQWDLGIITSYFSYPDLDVSGLTDIDNDNLFDNFPGSYKAATYETVLSLAYRF